MAKHPAASSSSGRGSPAAMQIPIEVFFLRRFPATGPSKPLHSSQGAHGRKREAPPLPPAADEPLRPYGCVLRLACSVRGGMEGPDWPGSENLEEKHALD